jgi:hypothetical protein
MILWNDLVSHFLVSYCIDCQFVVLSGPPLAKILFESSELFALIIPLLIEWRLRDELKDTPSQSQNLLAACLC